MNDSELASLPIEQKLKLLSQEEQWYLKGYMDYILQSHENNHPLPKEKSLNSVLS